MNRFKKCLKGAAKRFNTAVDTLKSTYTSLFQQAAVFDPVSDGYAALVGLLVGLGAAGFTAGLSIPAAVEFTIGGIVTNHVQKALQLGVALVDDYIALRSAHNDEIGDCINDFNNDGGILDFTGLP